MFDDISDDIELVERLQGGDLAAFDILFRKYSGKIYSFAFKYLRCREESSELVQSVFLKLWENHKNLKKESSLKSYLFTMAYNEICSLFRRRICLQRYFEHIRLEKSHISNETEESIDCNSLIERLSEIFSQLPERQRSIFLKSRIEGKPSKVIAHELGLSPGTVDNYISKTLRVIDDKLAEETLLQ
ncbi:MAG: RNA polymerase sigma-70 factor [Bacteroidales bacterium]|jgi:RNA polymerase sigma-70 factor (ECF subfamily)|nr:RNA polymerase sigma-70 factor [Bacteroidales bacterium]